MLDTFLKYYSCVKRKKKPIFYSYYLSIYSQDSSSKLGIAVKYCSLLLKGIGIRYRYYIFLVIGHISILMNKKKVIKLRIYAPYGTDT